MAGALADTPCWAPSQHLLAARLALLTTDPQHCHTGDRSKVKLVVSDGGVMTLVRKCLWQSGDG